jgi:hypothetical protein
MAVAQAAANDFPAARNTLHESLGRAADEQTRQFEFLRQRFANGQAYPSMDGGSFKSVCENTGTTREQVRLTKGHSLASTVQYKLLSGRAPPSVRYVLSRSRSLDGRGGRDGEHGGSSPLWSIRT